MPKMRGYTCKWCDRKIEKKEEYWQHIRSHINPKKLLACKSCSFVTEYKHHLEYHSRSHTGLKPYKCEKCEYQCVNMSMLKSHMKSHSPDCPYRCSSCRYSTKYAHSLKMHRKKYHQNQHHDQLMIEVFSPKTENSNDVPKNDSNSISPASTVISTSTTNNNDAVTPFSDHSTNTPLIDMNCILDLRISSKLQSN